AVGRPSHHATDVAFRIVPKGVHATASLQQREYGTEVHLTVAGLDDNGWYWLWLTDSTGQRVAAGTFWAHADEISVDMNSALQLAQTRRVWVTDDHNTVVLDTGFSRQLAASAKA